MKKAHFIGLCGAGMSSVANLLHEHGYEITGSDQGTYDPIKSYLEDIGLECKTPHDPAHIPDNPDMIVIGRHAKLVPETTEEVKVAFDTYPDRIKSFPDVLNELTAKTQNLVVIGSYGKSTCTSLLAFSMIDNDLDPSYFLGALSLDLPRTSHAGSDKYFILEGDEYPSSNTDLSSKFLHYNASSVLLTAGEHDHVNVFPTIDDYLTPFYQLLQTLPAEGLVVGCIDNPNVPELLDSTNARVVTYGMSDKAHYYARNIQYGETSSFELMHEDTLLGSINTQLLGTHNIQNMVGVAAFLLEHEILTIDQIANSFAAFQGIKRRLDKRSTNSTVPVYEGFGSSYTKARTAIEALQLHFPQKKLVVAFEPHTFSWRNRASLDWYETVFDGVDEVLMYKPPTHGSEQHDQLTLDEILEHTKKHHSSVHSTPSHEELIKAFEKVLDQDSVLLILTSGSFDNGISMMVEWCEKQFQE